jgi:hypothetical protein
VLFSSEDSPSKVLQSALHASPTSGREKDILLIAFLPYRDQSFFFPSGLAQRWAPNRKEKRVNHYAAVTRGGARSSLAPGYFLSRFQGLVAGSLRSRN